MSLNITQSKKWSIVTPTYEGNSKYSKTRCWVRHTAYKYQLYFSIKCVDIWDKYDNNRVFQSINKVLFADGSIDYLTFHAWLITLLPVWAYIPTRSITHTYWCMVTLQATIHTNNFTWRRTRISTTCKRLTKDLINSTNIYKACFLSMIQES